MYGLADALAPRPAAHDAHKSVSTSLPWALALLCGASVCGTVRPLPWKRAGCAVLLHTAACVREFQTYATERVLATPRQDDGDRRRFGEVEASPECLLLAREIWAARLCPVPRHYPSAAAASRSSASSRRKGCCKQAERGPMNVLVLGDLCGRPGHEALLRRLPDFGKARWSCGPVPSTRHSMPLYSMARASDPVGRVQNDQAGWRA